MNRSDFVAHSRSQLESIIDLLETKGRDYADEGDALDNFKRNARALDLTPEQVWAVYAGKHWDAIQTYCRTGAVTSEGIEGRLHDLINYCLLQLAMVEERQRAAAIVAIDNAEDD